jgi:hypothetical protein
MGWACSTHGKVRNSYKTLIGKLKGKRPQGRPRSRWDDNVTLDLREIGWEIVDWIQRSQGRD